MPALGLRSESRIIVCRSSEQQRRQANGAKCHRIGFEDLPGIVGAAIVPHAPQFLTAARDRGPGASGRGSMPRCARSATAFRARDPDLLTRDLERALRRFRHQLRAGLCAALRRAGRRQRRSIAAEWPVDGAAGYALVARAPGSRLRPGLHARCRARHRLYDPARILRLSGAKHRSCRYSSTPTCRRSPARALLRLRPGAGAGDRADRPARRRAGQRRAVALPGHAALPAPRYRHRSRSSSSGSRPAICATFLSLDAAALDRSGNVECRGACRSWPA